MADLQHYNLYPDFSLYEAAWLAAGSDPAAHEEDTMANTILSAMERAFEGAMEELSRVDGRSAELSGSLLRPICLDPQHPDMPPISITRLEVAKARLRHQGDPHVIRFARDELARWFKERGNGFVPRYAFNPSQSGESSDGDKRATAADVSTRERTTLLNTIAALLELVLTPRGGRTSQAAVIDELTENYADKQGIAKSTLEANFKKAKQSLGQP